MAFTNSFTRFSKNTTRDPTRTPPKASGYTAWFVENKAWEDPTPKDGVTPVFAKVKEDLSAVFKQAGEVEGSKLPDSIEAAFRRTAGLEGGVEFGPSAESLAEAKWVESAHVKPRTVEENIQAGREAILKALDSHENVLDAMFREDVGSISFYWGTPGEGPKFKQGEGLAHIDAKHGRDVLEKMPEVIAKGQIVARQREGEIGERVKVAWGGHTAVLSLWKQGGRETWLLTGWEDDVPGASGGGNGPSGATQAEPMRTRLDLGAGAHPDEKITPPAPSGKTESNSVRPLTLRPWEFGGAPDQLVEVRERVDATQETMLRGTLPDEFRKYAVNINLEKVESQGDVQGIIQATADALKPQMEAMRRGVVGDAAVREGALELLGASTKDVAGDLGLTEETLLQRRQGEAFNAEYALGSRIILYNSAQNLADLARSVRSGRNSDSELLDFRRRLELHIGLQAQVSGVAAEAGRALRSFRQLAGTVEVAPGVFMNPHRVKSQGEVAPDFRLPGEAPAAPEVAPPGQMSLDAFRQLIDSAGGRKAVEQMAQGIADLALAQVAVGSGLMALATSLVDQGIITGGGPTDPGERNVWLLTNQPYSVKIGDNWYSWGGVGEPVTTFFALAADFHQAYNTWALEPKSSPSEMAAALTVAFSKNITQKTFLKGVADLVGALNDPDRNAEKVINSMAGSFVPAYLGNWAMAQDPEIRLVGGALDAVLNRIPGARGTLPIRRNLWGEPLMSTEFGPSVAWWSPVKLKKDNGSPIDKEMVELGMSVQMPKETISIRGGEVELSKEEYSRYMELVGEVMLSWRGTPMTPM